MGIVVAGEVLRSKMEAGSSHYVRFVRRDDGDVYTLLGHEQHVKKVKGSLHFVDGRVALETLGARSDQIRLLIRRKEESSGKESQPKGVLGLFQMEGYVRTGDTWTAVPVQIVPFRDDLFARCRGILETDLLAHQTVSVIGLGSGGSFIVHELAKTGIMEWYLVDHDRLEVGNLMRHIAGLSEIGRYKTRIMADVIREKNPYAKIQTWEVKVDHENKEQMRTLVRESDLVICAMDNRAGRLVLNRLCVEEGKTCIMAGAYRRAYGGQVLRIRPGEGPCYQCLLQTLPQQANDREISSAVQAEGFAYSDRPVAIEPGLSNDINPLSMMVVKLAIQALLHGKETTLRSLDDDLAADLYMWLNRREAGTGYEKLEPLGFNVGGLHILQWVPLPLERDPSCPCCGNFTAKLVRQGDVTIPADLLAEYGG